MGKHDHLLHLTPPEDPRHPRMSLHNRAAQFAPFDALTGFGGRIHESSRLTDQRVELTEESQAAINEKLLLLEEHIKEHPVVTVTFFVPDLTKMGGHYQTLTARAVKIDPYEERLQLDDETRIAFEDIVEVWGER